MPLLVEFFIIIIPLQFDVEGLEWFGSFFLYRRGYIVLSLIFPYYFIQTSINPSLSSSEHHKL